MDKPNGQEPRVEQLLTSGLDLVVKVRLEPGTFEFDGFHILFFKAGTLVAKFRLHREAGKVADVQVSLHFIIIRPQVPPVNDPKNAEPATGKMDFLYFYFLE